MEVYRNGEVIGKMGMAMIDVGPCETCNKQRALMYALWLPNGDIIAATCDRCLHTGGQMFGGLYSNASKDLKLRRENNEKQA